MSRGVWARKPRPRTPARPGQIAPKPEPHDTHGPVYVQMFDFTGPRTGRPRSATAAQEARAGPTRDAGREQAKRPRDRPRLRPRKSGPGAAEDPPQIASRND